MYTAQYGYGHNLENQNHMNLPVDEFNNDQIEKGKYQVAVEIPTEEIEMLGVVDGMPGMTNQSPGD